MNHNFTLEVLNDLIEVCKDGEQDFKLCARHTTSQELRARFLARATRCRSAIIALQAHVVEYGGRGEAGASPIGTLNRVWLKARGAVFGFDDKDAIEAGKQAEQQLLSRYHSVMQSVHLPEAVRFTAERYHHALQHMHRQMRLLYALVKAPGASIPSGRTA